jgi:hypothetical protein
MPFDIEHTGGGRGGRNHRQPTPEQCMEMHDLIDAYIDANGLCPDCTTVRMGVGLLSYVAMDLATDSREVLDKDKLKLIVADLHAELDGWIGHFLAHREGE